MIIAITNGLYMTCYINVYAVIDKIITTVKLLFDCKNIFEILIKTFATYSRILFDPQSRRVYLTITQLLSAHLPRRNNTGVVFIMSLVHFRRESLPHAPSLSHPMQFLHPFLKGGFITLLKAFPI